MTSRELSILAQDLQAHPAVVEKASIQAAYAPASEVSGNILLGDDCAAIPQSDGSHLLFASEGMLPSFVDADPWFAGYCAVMVNLSDIAAMGGSPIAITDVLWTPTQAHAEQIWLGMQVASRAYDVPIVGGHTTITNSSTGKVHLAASVLGRAGDRLITSFDAEPGDQLVIAIDMTASYRDEKPFWNASTEASPAHLQNCLALLPQVARDGLVRAGKDISNGGIIGTLAMLIHCSQVGANLNLDRLFIPENTDWLKWLTTFPSYGYLFAVKEKDAHRLKQLFKHHNITSANCGHFVEGADLTLQTGPHTHTLTLP